MTGLAKYQALRDDGVSALAVWRQAESDGLDPITRIRLIRELYALSLAEAKTVLAEARSGLPLADEQEHLIEPISQALDLGDGTE